ncbi:MAG: hypothetical protein IPP71_18290 [Bacteroidetes bacterium]|nr:hypothetical protein [Bacteroidota bacterium]
MAGNENMYTMLNGALGDVSDPLAYNRYLEFLDLLGKRFKDNKWLAFYDILNEPLYKYKYAHADGDINFYTKKQACELVEDFYNALKNPNADPNHLVSGGNLVTEDVILFDPSLMKLDFSQPHLYSEKFISYDGMNLTNKINRVNGSTYWVYKNIPMPWINGETGFPSSDVFPIGVNLVAGTNQDQKTYADNILSSTRDHGGSGFTWWNFQDGAWEEYGTEIFGYGLLILESGIDKPAVNSFQSYLDPSTNQPPQ